MRKTTDHSNVDIINFLNEWNQIYLYLRQYSQVIIENKHKHFSGLSFDYNNANCKKWDEKTERYIYIRMKYNKQILNEVPILFNVTCRICQS